MLVNASNLKTIFVNLKTIFNNAFDAAPSQFREIAMVVPSTGKQNDYAWLSGFPRMQKWVGEKAVKALAEPGQITMYTTLTCPYCAQAKVWLNGHGVPWRECNIDRDAACRATYESQGGPGVPLLNVNGHWQLGFDPQWLAKALQAPPRQPRPSNDGSPRP